MNESQRQWIYLFSFAVITTSKSMKQHAPNHALGVDMKALAKPGQIDIIRAIPEEVLD